MELTAEQILENWSTLLGYITDYIEEPRQTKLLELYNKYSERLMFMPAAHKKEYHNAMPGGYVDHVIRVIECSIDQHEIWEKHGVDTSTYTFEELIFSALNHDLGKMGDDEHESYIPQTDNWRKEKLGEDYMFNEKLAFASVPDRGLFLLQSHGIQYSFNEMITIQTHDGLYDEANKKYLLTYMPGQKARTALPSIVHQGDFMAARIEWEREWLDKLKKGNPKPNFKLASTKIPAPNNSKKDAIRNKALGSIKSDSLKNLLDNL
jgi:hypothetical protein